MTDPSGKVIVCLRVYKGSDLMKTCVRTSKYSLSRLSSSRGTEEVGQEPKSLEESKQKSFPNEGTADGRTGPRDKRSRHSYVLAGTVRLNYRLEGYSLSLPLVLRCTGATNVGRTSYSPGGVGVVIQGVPFRVKKVSGGGPVTSTPVYRSPFLKGFRRSQ